MDNPSRIILHIDMNSYFASVEQQANPFLRGKPIGITGKNQERSVVATASIEAKALGVKTAMSTWEAKKICPSIMFWSGDPEKYSDIMHRFNTIYESFTPHVEPFSVDESFLDITEEAEDYFGATCMAQAIRSRLHEELGERITASIGIAPNNLMAKLASGHVKPNGLTVVRPEDCLKLLDDSELDDLCGIGPRIKERLHAMGISNFKQLREFPRENLEHEFHSYGTWLHEAAWAGVRSPVVGFSEYKGVSQSSKPTTGDLTPDAKSYGHSYTLPENTSDACVLKRYLFGLADKVGWRMRRDNVTARRVTAFVRFGDFSSHGEQRTFHEPTADGMQLFHMAWRILEPICLVDVRLIGLSASLLSHGSTQPSLFKKERNMTSVLSALDELQKRYGSGVWKRGATLQTEFKSRSSGFHFDHEV
ncbi:DNA polymerase IV [Patescibacteria group bacterium]|nr:MAG: DNA polymerase IV [Patescibacteria group bacterium]